jgi:type II secretory pathway pseudopilin PulG
VTVAIHYGETNGILSANRRQIHGFTYLGLLILLALVGVAAAASVQLGAIVQRRAAEEDLLAIGNEFRRALITYADATPAGQKRAPATLQDLLKDPRYPEIKRHLRKLYADPLTGKEEWGVVMWQDGSGIAGIYSLAPGQPIRIGNFAAPFQEFGGKTAYREWIFKSTDANVGSMPNIGQSPSPNSSSRD